jgi:putative Mn2+ efflux pump MntP
MCALTNYLTYFFAEKITEKTVSLGGLILIAVGVFNLLKEKNNTLNTEWKGAFCQSVVTGFAVGLDGALANLSLSLMGLNDFYVPIVIAFTHAIMIYLGILLSQTVLAKKFAKIEFIPPLILILLGGYKLLGLFI